MYNNAIQVKYTALLIYLLVTLYGCNSSSQTLELRAEGEGFYWYFTLAGADEKFDTEDDIKIDQTIYLPVNKEINIQVTSRDYLYMFRSSRLNLKEVAVPNMIFNINFITDQTGKYELEVDPLCGFNFAHDNAVMGHIIMTSNNDFKDWLRNKI
jgi:heme/copper-type cytochrome/quinol oxidase subunit 2